MWTQVSSFSVSRSHGWGQTTGTWSSPVITTYCIMNGTGIRKWGKFCFWLIDVKGGKGDSKCAKRYFVHCCMEIRLGNVTLSTGTKIMTVGKTWGWKIKITEENIREGTQGVYTRGSNLACHIRVGPSKLFLKLLLLLLLLLHGCTYNRVVEHFLLKHC